MKKRRIITRLDVKGSNVVKGIQFEGLRIMGSPAEIARKAYTQGADELIYIDVVASLYERNSLLEVIEEASSLGIAIPMTVGGGIRKLDDITNILRAGADKVAINTAATRDPAFITAGAKRFGRQCIVGSIQAKKQRDGSWEAYVDNGRERTGLDAIEWASKLVDLGCGELFVTSIDQDGTKKGFDTDLITQIVKNVSVPVIACGGAGSENDIHQCFDQTACDGVAFATLLHYDLTTIERVKQAAADRGVCIRNSESHLESDTVAQQNNSGDTKKCVSIIDYGLGNLKSVTLAFEALGHQVKTIATPAEIIDAELLVLPGVGSFADGMAGLHARGLVEPIRQYAIKGWPLLGICLGMQLLMSHSEEFGQHNGLKIISGSVKPFKSPADVNIKHYRVPHVGWNTLCAPKNISWNGSILENSSINTDVYFVHSFMVIPEKQNCTIANAQYGDQTFAAVVQDKLTFGTQFHPEKSGPAGKKMLHYFSQL